MPTFHFHAVPEHGEVPLADHGKLEQTIEHADAVAAYALPPASDSRTNKADYIVAVSRNRDANARAAQLSEMVSLVENQGDRVVGSELIFLSNPNPKTLLGPGQAQAVADRARAVGAQMLVVDAELSPSQTRNLEDVVKLPVCDREAIILNVFRLRARTQQARVQIELAQLEYLRPRIRGVGLDMDQQIASLTSIGTPHKGCFLVDHLLQKIPKKVVLSFAKKYNLAYQKLGDKTPDFYQGIFDLTTEKCNEFNLIATDKKNVHYQSLTSIMNNTFSAGFPLNLGCAMVSRHEGKNDGFVSIESSKHGEFLGCYKSKRNRGISHGDMIDLMRENIPGFDVCELYVNLVKGLKEKGF